MNDPILELLKNTGWSCDELMNKLQHYKSLEGEVNNQNTEGEATNDAQPISTKEHGKLLQSLVGNIPNENTGPKTIHEQDIGSSTEREGNSKVPDDNDKDNCCNDIVLVTSNGGANKLDPKIIVNNCTDQGRSDKILEVVETEYLSEARSSIEISDVDKSRISENNSDESNNEIYLKKANDSSRNSTVSSCNEDPIETTKATINFDDKIIVDNSVDKSQNIDKIIEVLNVKEQLLEVAESNELCDNDNDKKHIDINKSDVCDNIDKESMTSENYSTICNEDVLVKPIANTGSKLLGNNCFDNSKSSEKVNEISNEKNHPLEVIEINELFHLDKNKDLINKSECDASSSTINVKHEDILTSNNTVSQIRGDVCGSSSINYSILSKSSVHNDENSIEFVDSPSTSVESHQVMETHCNVNLFEYFNSDNRKTVEKVKIVQNQSIVTQNKDQYDTPSCVTTDTINIKIASDHNYFPKETANTSVEDITSNLSNVTSILDQPILRGNTFEIVDEHDAGKLESNSKSESSGETEVSVKLEDIRNNLKMQLNNLRTKKKDPLLNKITKQIDFDLETNKKIDVAEKINFPVPNDKVQNQDTTPTARPISDINIESNSIDNQMETISIENPSASVDIGDPISEECLYTQTMDFGFVISCVEGGIELNTDDNLQNVSEEGITDLEGHTTEPQEIQVIDEIRKIIQKPKPKIFINKELAKLPDCFLDANQKEVVDHQDNSLVNSSNENTESYPENEAVKKISPFVSNTLDEFLTEDAQLNISYNVPKCEAEQGLKESIAEDGMLLLKKVVKVKGAKGSSLKQPTSAVKAKTVAQKRKLLEREKIKEKKIEKKVNISLGHHQNKRQSYVLVDNIKLWVNSITDRECIAVINSHNKQNSSMSLPNRPKKSLLKECKRNYRLIQYKPGPLCHKRDLQINEGENWETHLITLPKIYLEIYPKLGHPLPPYIINRISYSDGNLSNMQIDFALSALKTKVKINSEPNKFVFPLKYRHNQEQLIIRRKKIPQFSHDSNLSSNMLENGDNVIADVIEGLIKYVEIKEIEQSLLKEDDIEFDKEHMTNESISPENNKISVIKKRQKKSKIDLELLRLNCKLVNVEVEDKVDDVPCNKSFCQLGCVCNSLKCDNISTYHCQKLDCMFGCTCPKDKRWVFDHNLKLPAGSDLLSSDTVSRIEDEAKKNLAKVEREFTQTIIYANDKTIVVGLGGRNKSKRAPKVPKRFDDYVGISDDLVNPAPGAVPTRECKVQLTKLNLSDIVPYCLNHNLYDCECKCLSVYTHEDSKKRCRDEEDVNEEQKMSKQLRIEKTLINEEGALQDEDPLILTKSIKRKTYNPKVLPNKKSKKSISGESTSFQSANEDPLLINPSEESIFSETETCARTRGIPQTFKKRVNENYVSVNDFKNNITESDILQSKLKSPENAAEDLKTYIIQNSFPHTKFLKSQKKRKQILEVRNDHDVNLKGRMNKETRKAPQIASIDTDSENSDAPSIQPYFPGEVILYNKELLKEIGSKALYDGYARVIPWKVLCQSFRDETIHIWCVIDQPSRLLINKSGSQCPKNYIDIRKCKRVTDVIGWILSGKLPSCYLEDQVSLILRETKNNFEICGMCNGTITNSPKDYYNHKDINGEPRKLSVKMQKFKLQELFEHNFEDNSISKSKLYMKVALPEISDAYKWRLVFLNSDFTYLFFKEIKYSIKYKDLINIVQIAKANNTTVFVKDHKKMDKYLSEEFGIYFDSNHTDRIFIGPYLKDFSEIDIETLRYIDKTLVCTESFNKMRGIGDYKCGHWLTVRPGTSNVIDLTEDEPGISEPPETKQGTQNNSVNTQNQVQKNQDSQSDNSKSPVKAKIQIVDVSPRKPEDFNRYLITNIPHFGYLGAFQDPVSSEIDVSWPFEKKVLRFRDTEIATKFLQERFSSLLQPIPASFKIQIIILTSLDLKSTKPIDAKFLTGQYICGEFGIYDVKTLTDEDALEKVGLPKIEITEMMKRRSKLIVKKCLSNLANLLGMNFTGEEDTEDVLNKASAEITKLEREVKVNEELKNSLGKVAKSNAIKAFKLLKSAPQNLRNKHCLQFKSIISNTEVIEINDSDEEEPVAKDPLHITPEKTKDCDSDKRRLMVTVPKALSKTDNSINSPLSSPGSIQSSPESLKLVPPGRLLQGVKIVKTSSGNLVMISDKANKPQTNLKSGTQVIIKNNRIQSISKNKSSFVVDKSYKKIS